MGQRVFDVLRLSSRGVGWVFVCYLDDSDNHNGPNIAIGGYIARVDQWAAFERQIEPILGQFGVEVLRGKDFQNGHGSFKGWSGQDKSFFVEALYSEANRYVPFAVASTVRKTDFKRLIKKAKILNVSPLALAFSVVLGNVILKELRPLIGRENETSLSVVIESGNKNNGNLVWLFDQDKAKGDPLSRFLGSISFIGKHDCRAIQLADFFAFHARRGSEQWEENRYEYTPPSGHALEIMHKHIKHRYNRIYGEELVRGVDPTAEGANPMFLPEGGGLNNAQSSPGSFSAIICIAYSKRSSASVWLSSPASIILLTFS